MTLVRLAEVTRGHAVESLHVGAVAVVDTAGKLLYHAGDPEHFTFTRSTLKPLQALPFVSSGGIEHFGFDARHLALMCASHSGEAMHVQLVQAMLDALSCSEAQLQCGTHEPIASSTPPPYSQLHNNCSGKHTGFLGYCRLHALPLASYLDPGHPLQQAIRAAVAHVARVSTEQLKPVIDSCSAPNYALPLSRLALGYARLAQDDEDGQYGDALRRIFQAMTRHPELVAGTGRFDTELMQEGKGDWVAKGGAEGVQAIGIRSAGIGIAIKVADGNARALYPAALSVLEQLGLLKELPQASSLAAWRQATLRNLRNLTVGEVRPAVKLVKA